MMMTQASNEVVFVENRRAQKLREKKEKRAQELEEEAAAAVDPPAAPVLPQKRYSLRRFDAEAKKEPQLTCFRCRLPGHLARDCVWKGPEKKESDAISEKSTVCSESTAPGKKPSGACFRCGQSGHLASECKALIYPCRICGEQSHLTKDCTNMRCDECGVAGHFARDCQQRKERLAKEHEAYQAREARRREQRANAAAAAGAARAAATPAPPAVAAEGKGTKGHGKGTNEEKPAPLPPALADTDLFPALGR